MPKNKSAREHARTTSEEVSIREGQAAADQRTSTGTKVSTDSSKDDHSAYRRSWNSAAKMKTAPNFEAVIENDL